MGNITPRVGAVKQAAPVGLAPKRLLAGGPENLTLSWGQAAWVVAGGLLVAAIRAARGMAADPGMGWGGLVGALANPLVGLTVAACASRWLGSRTGLVAGLVHGLTGPILLPVLGSAQGGLVALAVGLAVGAFAGAEVPGVLRPVNPRLMFALFCGALAGSTLVTGFSGPACCLAICFLYLLLFQDSRGVKFFAGWRKAPVLAGSVFGPWLVWKRASGVFFACDGQPAGPWVRMLETSSQPVLSPALCLTGLLLLGALACVAIASGLRRGLYATPFARLLGAWLAAPWAVSTLGLWPLRLAWVAVAPCIAVLSAGGLLQCLTWYRRARGGVLRRLGPARRAAR